MNFTLPLDFCPNCCKRQTCEFAHVWPQLDSVTGEEFIPVGRIIDGEVCELLPTDYCCQYAA